MKQPAACRGRFVDDVTSGRNVCGTPRKGRIATPPTVGYWPACMARFDTMRTHLLLLLLLLAFFEPTPIVRVPFVHESKRTLLLLALLL